MNFKTRITVMGNMAVRLMDSGFYCDVCQGIMRDGEFIQTENSYKIKYGHGASSLYDQMVKEMVKGYCDYPRIGTIRIGGVMSLPY